MDYTIAALDRALALLETVGEHPGIGLTELARRTGTTKTLAFRVASTLERRGYILKEPVSRTYTLGPMPLYLGERMERSSLLLQLAGPALDRLAEETQENVSLVVRDGLRSVCIANRQSPQPIRLYAELGRQGPLHVGGGPKLLLAFAPPEVQRAVLAGPLPAFTPETITDPARLAGLLKRIRGRDYHVSRGDLDAGAFSVAAPVRDRGGAVIASVSAAGPQSRLSREAEQRTIKLVRATGAALSGQLGWQAPAGD